MDAVLERLSPGQIVAVISIAVGGIVALAMIISITRYQFQSLADETALKLEKQQADLALREKLIERREASGEKASVGELLALGAGTPEYGKADVDLARRFGMLDASAEVIERTLSLALGVDPERKRMIASVMDELIENGAEAEATLAAVRPLCAGSKAARVKAVCAEEAACS
jgi:hypothetical protein